MGFLPSEIESRLKSIYISITFLDLERFSSFLIYTESVGFLGRGISPSQGRYLHTAYTHT
jgi:hypothetical protein